MTATNGGTVGVAAEINVTPMIDILLAVLVIFMVIVPALPRGEAAVVPRRAPGGSSTKDAIILKMTGAGDTISFRINQQHVAQEELQSRRACIYVNRAQRVLFLKRDDRLNFTQIAEAIDLCHSAGVDQNRPVNAEIRRRAMGGTWCCFARVAEG